MVLTAAAMIGFTGFLRVREVLVVLAFLAFFGYAVLGGDFFFV